MKWGKGGRRNEGKVTGVFDFRACVQVLFVTFDCFLLLSAWRLELLKIIRKLDHAF